MDRDTTFRIPDDGSNVPAGMTIVDIVGSGSLHWHFGLYPPFRRISAEI
jgi:hypothetical protein